MKLSRRGILFNRRNDGALSPIKNIPFCLHLLLLWFLAACRKRGRQSQNELKVRKIKWKLFSVNRCLITVVIGQQILCSIFFEPCKPSLELWKLWWIAFNYSFISISAANQSSRDQTVMIVDDSFNYHARLNTNYHALSSTIINYDQLSRGLDVFKFHMIVDDSFLRLIGRMIVHDSFSVSGFAQNGLNATFFPT